MFKLKKVRPPFYPGKSSLVSPLSCREHNKREGLSMMYCMSFVLMALPVSSGCRWQS